MSAQELKPVEVRVDTPKRMTYGSEQALVDELLGRIRAEDSPWRSDEVMTEFCYGRGRTDVLVRHNGEIVAIEAKLTKWRDALDQAYRNTCFAHRSFVCVPTETAGRAARYVGEFEMRGVGLCTIRDGAIVVLCESSRNEPLQPWLCEAAVAAVDAACAQS